jgi:hypothetical protein
VVDQSRLIRYFDDHASTLEDLPPKCCQSEANCEFRPQTLLAGNEWLNLSKSS